MAALRIKSDPRPAGFAKGREECFPEAEMGLGMRAPGMESEGANPAPMLRKYRKIGCAGRIADGAIKRD
jgi:hypothetical protein